MLNFSSTFNKTVANLSWLSFDRIIRLIGAVFVNAWLTRYLGPDQNGILNYALAFSGMFAPLAILGLDAIVIRDIVRNPANKDEILGSAFGLRLIGAIAALIFAGISISIVRPDDILIKSLVVISAVGMLFQSFDVIDYWFQSQIESKYTVYARNSSFIIINVLKIISITAGAPIYIFVILISVELIFSSFALVYTYRFRGHSVVKWRFKMSRATSLLLNSWPIIISDFAIFIQARIDQIMIGEFLNNGSLGLYAAAQKISEPLGFIPMVIMSSVYPVIIKTKEWSEDEFYRRMRNLYRAMFILVVLICLPISIFSNHIVSFLYGIEFQESGTILTLIIWTRFYAFYGVARSIFISSENLFLHALISSLSGVSVSIIANYYLIQAYGVYGAIIASHLGFIFTIFIVDGISKSTRRNFLEMIRGIFTFYKFSLKN